MPTTILNGEMTPENFKRIEDPALKMDHIYGMLVRDHIRCASRIDVCRARFLEIERMEQKSRKLDLTTSGISGFLGGFAAMIARWWVGG